MARKKKITPIKLTKRISPQAALVLDYLTTRRSLTPLIASSTLGIASISARIAELRKAGVPISTIFDEDHMGRRYGTYSLS